MNILQKGYLYFNTVKYLKKRQIVYQLKYRAFGFAYPDSASVYKGYLNNFMIAVPDLDLDERYIERFCIEDLLDNRITLLYESVVWKPGKWEDKEKNHLWNFNLHYLEYFIVLAGAYRRSGDMRYVRKMKELYLDWHQCFERKKYKDAWHPYTSSLRIVNLFICMDLLGDILAGDSDFWNILLQDQYRTYLFIRKNRERNLLGNHYFENLCAVYIASVFFKEDRISDRYERLLIKEAGEQILRDGMHYERSLMYHNLILEDFMRIELAAQQREKKNEQFIGVIRDCIYRMADAVYSLERGNDARLPLFNDTGSNIAKSPDQLLKAAGRDVNYSPRLKYSFSEAGYFILENKEIRVIFDCGEIAPDYITGHGHCDALSFELYCRSIPVLVNAGTFQYQTSLRRFFRSDCAHNTVRVNGEDQSECWGEHRTARRVKILEVQDHTPSNVTGVIETYKGVKIKRRIELSEKGISLKDKIWGLQRKGSSISSYFRVHPRFKVKAGRKGNVMLISYEESRLQFAIEADRGSWILHQDDLCHYSEQFGVREKTDVLELYQEPGEDRLNQCITISIVEVNTDD